MSEWQETIFGKAPGYWKIETIGALSEKVTDGSHFSPKPCSVGEYMCSVKDMTYDRFDFSNCKLISQNDFYKLVTQGCKPEKNDILISKDGANCLDLIFVFDQEEDLVLLSSIAIVRLLPDINSKFVRYFLLSPACQYIMRNNFVSGSAIPRVVLKDFKKVSILLPPLSEQKAIASVLSSLDDKIDLLHRQNKTLEAIAETLFRQWFVEEAQEDWEEGVIKDLIEILSGFAFKSSSFVESGKYRLITIKGVQDGYLDKTNAARINDIPPRMPNYCFLQNRDILLSLTGNVGRCCLVDSNDLLLNQRVAKLQPKNNRDWAFTYILTRQIGMKKALEDLAKGTAQANLSPIEMANMKFPIPPEYLLEKFSKGVTPLLEKIMCNKTQIQTLEKFRDTLLPKLMSGEVRVEYEK